MDSSIFPLGNGADVSSIYPFIQDFNQMIVTFKDVFVSGRAWPCKLFLLQAACNKSLRQLV